MRNLVMKAQVKALQTAWAVKEALSNKKAEGFVDTAVKILISIVIGALLLAGLYALFNNVILPTLSTRIQDMFNYRG